MPAVIGNTRTLLAILTLLESRHVALDMSVDEALVLHERTSGPIREVLGLQGKGILRDAWVILGALAAGIVALVYVPFLKALPRRTSGLILLSGMIFVSGALGLEMVGGAIAQENGRYVLVVQVVAAAEELLQLVGIATFIFALSDYAARHCRRFGGIFREIEHSGHRPMNGKTVSQ